MYADGVPVIAMSEISPLHSVSPDFCVTPGARSCQLQLAEEFEDAQIWRETTWLRKAGSKRKHGSSGSSSYTVNARERALDTYTSSQIGTDIDQTLKYTEQFGLELCSKASLKEDHANRLSPSARSSRDGRA